MKIISKLMIVSLIILSPYITYGQDIVINEFMSSNQATLQDYEGEYSDWIEIKNISDHSINLKDYTLTDNVEILDKWIFPELDITANGYLVVFASGKNQVFNGEFHTSFKIKQAGETLILSNNLGDIISQTEAIFIPTDNSSARVSDDSNDMKLSSTPTPNAKNIFEYEINHSHSSGLYPVGFELELSTSNIEQQIYYTRNGNAPTTNSILYTGPIAIENNSQEDNSYSNIPTTPLSGENQLNEYIWKPPVDVYKCNVIRYASFVEGELSSEVFTKTYFVDSLISDRYSFPIISIVTDSLNLFDYERGIYIPGKRFDDFGFNWWPNGNYHLRGKEWERDIHISYFDVDGNMAFDTDAGMRMRGYGSASFPQKSFNVYFRKEYGLSKIDYPIFDNLEITQYKRLIFRNGGNDFLFGHFRDAMLHEVMRSMNLEIQAYKPSIVFINGEYWGIHNIREKYDKHYFKYKYGVDKDSINILGVCGDIEDGSNAEYDELIDFVSQNDMTVSANYASVVEKIEMENFIDYNIAEIYFANYDWPCNNYKMWKDKKPNSKWRFLIYDLDLSFGYSNDSHYSKNSLDHATSTVEGWPHCECSNLLFRKLLPNEAFQEQFIDRFSFHLKQTFNIERVHEIIKQFEDLYSKEMLEHIDRWNYPSTIEDWVYHIGQLKEYAEMRPCYMAEDIVNYFNLNSFDYDCADAIQNTKEKTNLILFPNPNNGRFSFYNNDFSDVVDAQIVIYNSIGKRVYTASKINIKQNEKYYINLGKPTNGIYIFMLLLKDSKTIRKLVISGQN